MWLTSYEYCNKGRLVFSQKYWSRGELIIIAYLCIDYVFPLIINLLLDTNPLFRLPLHLPEVFFALIFLIGVCFFSIFVSNRLPKIVPLNPSPLQPISRTILLVFSLLCCVLGVLIYTKGLVQWRYGQGLLSGGAFLLIISVLQSFLPVVCFWVLMTDHMLLKSKKITNILLRFLLCSALILSMNGLGSVIVVALFVFVFFMPKTALQVLFADKVTDTNGKPGFFKKLSFFIAVPLFCILFFGVGLFAKSGFNASLDESFKVYTRINYLINRHSVHLAIASASIEDGAEINRLYIPFNTLAYRVNLLLGRSSADEKPENSTFSRLALVEFADFENINPRGGASPGLIGAFTMTFPLLIAALALFLVIVFFVKAMDYILCRQPPFSWLGAFCFAYIPLHFIVDSPFDLIIIGPTMLVLFLLLLISSKREAVLSRCLQ